MVSARQPIVLRPGEGRSIDLGNFTMSVKATAEQTDQAFTLLEADEPPGFGPPMHINRKASEAFYVLAGEYVIFVTMKSTPALPDRSSSSPQVFPTDSELGRSPAAS